MPATGWPGAHRVGGILAAAGRGDVVGFIDDQQIVSPRIGRLVAGRQRLAESAQRPLALEEVDGGDQPREVRPGIDVDAALASQLADGFAVDDAELETELVPHLLLPLHLQGRRADDQHRADTVAQDHLLHHEASLDGLCQGQHRRRSAG